MTTIQTNNETWCFVGVSDDAICEISSDETTLAWQIPPETAFNDPMYSEALPPGTWSIFADTQTITEEQAAQVVEAILRGKWKNYEIVSQYVEYLYSAALESFASFLHCHSFHGRQIILKRVKK